MGEPARLRLKVRHYEVDLYGHVNHANYVHYLEVARTEALEGGGLSLPEMRRQGYHIVAVELAVKYHAPAHSGETLEIMTWLRELRGARSLWAQEIREATSGRLVVTAEVTGAFTIESGRPARTPAAFVERLAALLTGDRSAPSMAADAPSPPIDGSAASGLGDVAESTSIRHSGADPAAGSAADRASRRTR
jgi:YbgC/YbaW family acyl-CoA thioester hydrolase